MTAELSTISNWYPVGGEAFLSTGYYDQTPIIILVLYNLTYEA
jgi:hypothetical protein